MGNLTKRSLQYFGTFSSYRHFEESFLKRSVANSFCRMVNVYLEASARTPSVLFLILIIGLPHIISNTLAARGIPGRSFLIKSVQTEVL